MTDRVTLKRGESVTVVLLDDDGTYNELDVAFDDFINRPVISYNSTIPAPLTVVINGKRVIPPIPGTPNAKAQAASVVALQGTQES